LPGVKTKQELKREWQRARAERAAAKTSLSIRTSRQRILAARSLMALAKRLRGAR
jgi:hypothetical protein